MTPNKAIKQLRILITPLMSDLKRQAIDKAIEALEKQIPKKPDYATIGDTSVNYRACPICKQPADIYRLNKVTPHYCFYCGQALDWDDER